MPSCWLFNELIAILDSPLLNVADCLKKYAYIETDLAKPFSYWKPLGAHETAQLKLTVFCSKLYQLITIKVMDIFSKNIVSGNSYCKSTVSSTVLQIYYRSNIGYVLK